MVLFPIPESALMLNLKAWLADRDEAFLTGWTVTTVYPTDTNEGPDRLIVVAPGTATGRQIVDTGLLTITLLGPAGDYDTTLRAAQYLKAALPDLTGNGIAAITRVLGPTAASDVTGRPKRVLSVNYVSAGTTAA